MLPQIEPTLYIDPQAAIPVGYCQRCGGAIYTPGGECLRCGAKAP